MELRSIQYKNVYGYLSGGLTFTRGENFLVGINGCGKTTVLNLIRWILEPSLPDLCTLEHDLIRLDFKHEKFLYAIQSCIKDGQHELSIITKDTSHDFQPIKTTLHVDPKSIKNRSYLTDMKSRYKDMRPDPHEAPTWNFLMEALPSPVFVGLERNVQDHDLSRISRRNRLGANTREGRGPIGAAIGLMRDAYNTGQRKLVEINDELNRRVLELSFSGVLRQNLVIKASSANDLEKINQLKSRFRSSSDKGEYSKALSSSEVRTAIVNYLEQLSNLLSGKDKGDKPWIALNQHNFDRALKMFDLFEKHEQNARLAQKDLVTFIGEVDRFLKDSGKSIHFKENTGYPCFKTSTSTDTMSLSELSSGEAQIVILLSYFAFLAKTGVPIVIDEPELSLHVEWQKQFAESIQSVMPKECQTIMATHSPEICGATNVNVQAISIRGQS